MQEERQEDGSESMVADFLDVYEDGSLNVSEIKVIRLYNDKLSGGIVKQKGIVIGLHYSVDWL
jgi:hypothetical protein